MTEHLVVGRLGRTHGVWGEVRLQVMTDFPERLKRGVLVYVGEERRPERIRTCRFQNDIALVAFEGYGDRTAAEALRNQLVYVRADDRPSLSEGEYYQHQLIGMSVYTETYTEGTPPFGRISEILETGANDVLVIQRDTGGEVLLPMLSETILKIDLPEGVMVVHFLPGLI